MKVLSPLNQSEKVHERAKHEAVIFGERFDAFVEKLKTIMSIKYIVVI